VAFRSDYQDFLTMSQSPHIASFGDEDFQMIEKALLETARGRWFLEEHSRRSSQIQTRSLIQSLVRLERVVNENAHGPVMSLRRDAAALAHSLSGLAREIVGAADVNEGGRNFARIVADALSASLVIHKACEQIDETATVLGEQDVMPEVADSLKRQTEVVREALTAHEINARRIRALAEMLDFAENRLKALSMAEEALEGLPDLLADESEPQPASPTLN
jgi:chemotaxis protein CheZ